MGSTSKLCNPTLATAFTERVPFEIENLVHAGDTRLLFYENNAIYEICYMTGRTDRITSFDRTNTHMPFNF